MNTSTISNDIQRKIYELYEELRQTVENAQIIMDNTGVYLVTECATTEIERPINDMVMIPSDDVLMPYVTDVFTSLEERNQIIDHDVDDLLRITTDMNISNGQRMDAYKQIGDYLQNAQLGRTATALKRELHERSQRNGARIYQIATRVRMLFQEVGIPHTRNFRYITPDWIYKLPRTEFDRFLQQCNDMTTHLIENLWD